MTAPQAIAAPHDERDGAIREELHRRGLDTVAGVFAFAGGQDLDKPGLGHRRRTRLEIIDAAGTTHRLYLKRYNPEPAGLRLRRWLSTGRRVSPARAEYENIRAVRAVAPTMREIAFGEDDAGRSFLVVTAVPGEALERCGEAFLARRSPEAVAQFTRLLAKLVAGFHGGGLVHRDLYASHIFLHETPAGAELYLIDLARVFRPRWRGFRWRAKDLAQLCYSMPAPWVRSQWERFLDEYLGPAAASQRGRYERAIAARVRRMQARAARKQAHNAGGAGA